MFPKSELDKRLPDTKADSAHSGLVLKCAMCKATLVDSDSDGNIYYCKGGGVWTKTEPSTLKRGRQFFNKYKGVDVYKAECGKCGNEVGTVYPTAYGSRVIEGELAQSTFPRAKLLLTPCEDYHYSLARVVVCDKPGAIDALDTDITRGIMWDDGAHPQGVENWDNIDTGLGVTGRVRCDSATLGRTKMCKHANRSCRSGEKCEFAHTQEVRAHYFTAVGASTNSAVGASTNSASAGDRLRQEHARHGHESREVLECREERSLRGERVPIRTHLQGACVRSCVPT